jgi:hypothetical protein
VRTPPVDTAAPSGPQDATSPRHSRHGLVSSHVLIDGAELSGDDGAVFCGGCNDYTPFCFAESDGASGFILTCKNNCRRLLAYRAPPPTPDELNLS